MKRRTLFLTTAALIAVLIAVPFAYAQHMRARGAYRMGHDGGLGPMMMLGHLQHAKAALGLSDQQVADIKAIFQDLHTQNAASRDQLHGGMRAIAEALIANPSDIAGAQALLDKQEVTEHAMKVAALNAAAKALNILTPEQRGKLAEKVREHGARPEPK